MVVKIKVQAKGFKRLNNRVRKFETLVDVLPVPMSRKIAELGEEGIENWFYQRGHAWRGDRIKRLVFTKRITKNQAMIMIVGEAALFQYPGVKQHRIPVINANAPIKEWLASKGKLFRKGRQRKFVNYPVPWSDLGTGIHLDRIAARAIQENLPTKARIVWNQEIEQKL